MWSAMEKMTVSMARMNKTAPASSAHRTGRLSVEMECASPKALSAMDGSTAVTISTFLIAISVTIVQMKTIAPILPAPKIGLINARVERAYRSRLPSAMEKTNVAIGPTKSTAPTSPALKTGRSSAQTERATNIHFSVTTTRA